jgi:hypothetical protein
MMTSARYHPRIICTLRVRCMNTKASHRCLLSPLIFEFSLFTSLRVRAPTTTPSPLCGDMHMDNLVNLAPHRTSILYSYPWDTHFLDPLQCVDRDIAITQVLGRHLGAPERLSTPLLFLFDRPRNTSADPFSFELVEQCGLRMYSAGNRNKALLMNPPRRLHLRLKRTNQMPQAPMRRTQHKRRQQDGHGGLLNRHRLGRIQHPK